MKQDLNQHLFWKPELIVQRLRFTILSNKIIYVPQELNWYKIKTKSIYGIRITSLCSFLLISIKNLPNISTCKPFSTKISHKIYNTATTKSIYVEMRKATSSLYPKKGNPSISHYYCISRKTCRHHIYEKQSFPSKSTKSCLFIFVLSFLGIENFINQIQIHVNCVKKNYFLIFWKSNNSTRMHVNEIYKKAFKLNSFSSISVISFDN